MKLRDCKVLVAAVLIITTGCSKGPEVYPVHGRLLYEESPMDGALIIFHTTTRGERTLVMARANSNGEYTLATSGVQGGVFPGKYRVTVTWEEFSSPGTEEHPNRPGTGTDRLDGAYADASETPLRATVKAKDNAINFHLP